MLRYRRSASSILPCRPGPILVSLAPAGDAEALAGSADGARFREKTLPVVGLRPGLHGNIDEAERLYRSILEEDPRDPMRTIS